MKWFASLQLRIAAAVGLVLLCAAIVAGFYVHHEVLEATADAAAVLEYDELLLLLAPFALGAPVAAYIAARWSLRPLARIEQDAEAVSPGNLEQRLNEDRAPLEAVGLVRAVNGALDRLTAAYDHERQFTASAAHSLRTPLSVLSLRLQRAADQQLVDPTLYEEDLHRLRRVVDQLLDLRRIDSVEHGARDASVDVSRIGRSVAAELLPLAEAAERTLEVAAEHPRTARANEHSVSEILRNLVDNALVHGRGAISIATGQTGKRVWIDVSDDGPGPGLEIRAHSFNRFVRGAGSRGTGLGLAIARDAARSLGGELEWRAGSTIRLTLKPAPPMQDRTARLAQ